MKLILALLAAAVVWWWQDYERTHGRAPDQL